MTNSLSVEKITEEIRVHHLGNTNVDGPTKNKWVSGILATTVLNLDGCNYSCGSSSSRRSRFKLAFLWTLTSFAAVLSHLETRAGQLLSLSQRCREEAGHSWTDLVPHSEGSALVKVSCIRDWEQWVEYLLGNKLLMTSLSVSGRLEVTLLLSLSLSGGWGIELIPKDLGSVENCSHFMNGEGVNLPGVWIRVTTITLAERLWWKETSWPKP